MVPPGLEGDREEVFVRGFAGEDGAEVTVAVFRVIREALDRVAPFPVGVVVPVLVCGAVVSASFGGPVGGVGVADPSGSGAFACAAAS